MKRVVDTSMGTLGPALAAESEELAGLLSSGSHRVPMRRFLAAGGQTRRAEVANFPSLVDGLLSENGGDDPS